MSKYTINPWRHPSDLLQVRSQIYPSPSPSLPPSQDTTTHLTAINRIMAWKLRGNLPHAIESTALLTDAILHHHHHQQSQSQSQSSSSSSFSIRAVYSAAFTRFVTGFCDIGRSRERLLEPSSMLDIARKIGMPLEFVGLRHEATHEELPGLKRLMRATEEALRWLWEVYWTRLNEIEDGGAEVEGEVSEEGWERVREALKEFRGERKLALKKTKTGKLGLEEERTAKVCVDLVGGSAQGMERLVQILVQDKLLVPSKREIGDPLDGAYLIWDRLLRAILTQQKYFLPAFVKVLRKTISDPSTGQSEDDAEKEALCMWLVHTTNKKKSWTAVATSDLDVLRKEMVKWSCTHPGYWSHFLGVHLIKAGGSDFANIWEDVLEASRLGDGYVDTSVISDNEPEPEAASSPEWEVLEETHTQSRDVDCESKDVDFHSKSRDVDSHSQSKDIGSHHRGWRRAATAPNLPIGIVR